MIYPIVKHSNLKIFKFMVQCLCFYNVLLGERHPALRDTWLQFRIHVPSLSAVGSTGSPLLSSASLLLCIYLLPFSIVGGGGVDQWYCWYSCARVNLPHTTGVLHPHLVCQKGNSKRKSSFSMHQCSSLDYLDASSKLAAKSNRALSAVFARQASLLFFSLNVLCLLLMAKALPVKRRGAMGGTMNDIGRWSLKAFAPNISRRSLLDKVAVVSNRKPCGVWEFNHSTRYVGFLFLAVFLVRGGMANSAEVCIQEVWACMTLHRINKIWVNEKDYCTFRSHGLWTGRSYQPAGILISCLYRDGLTHFQPHYLTIDQLTSIWGGCCTKKSSSYGILQFSHPKKIQVFGGCACVLTFKTINRVQAIIPLTVPFWWTSRLLHSGACGTQWRLVIRAFPSNGGGRRRRRNSQLLTKE